MRSNKKLLAAAKLYLILDAQVLDYDALLQVLKDSVRAGVDIVQLRDKKGSAKDILDLSSKILKITKHQIPFIVNDRADIAILSGADGLHVGQEDIDYSQARKMMGSSKIIGVSCQNLAQARKAQTQGADYIGFGSVFTTQTKPERQAMDLDLLQKVIKQLRIPVFPIGGISRKNIGQLIPLEVEKVAVCRDILLAKDVGQAVRELKNFLRGSYSGSISASQADCEGSIPFPRSI
jgi:thiamine-phosphate pyrophosphorylase